MRDVTIEVHLRTSMDEKTLDDWVADLLREVNEHLLPPEEVYCATREVKVHQRNPWCEQRVHES